MEWVERAIISAVVRPLLSNSSDLRGGEGRVSAVLQVVGHLKLKYLKGAESIWVKIHPEWRKSSSHDRIGPHLCSSETKSGRSERRKIVEESHQQQLFKRQNSLSSGCLAFNVTTFIVSTRTYVTRSFGRGASESDWSESGVA